MSMILLIKVIFTASLFGELFLSAYPNASDSCLVSSKPTSECLLLNISSGFGCETIDDYAFKDAEKLVNRENVLMTFLPGVHNLTRNLTIREKVYLQLAGSEEGLILLYLHHESITIQNVTRFRLSSLKIDGMSSATMSMKDVLDVTIEDVVITGSAFLIQCLQCNTATISNVLFVGSVLVIAWPEYYIMKDKRYCAYKQVVIQDNVFHLSPTGNGLSCCNVHSLLITNSSISNLPHNSMAKPPESSLITFCAHYPWGLDVREVCDLLMANIYRLVILNSKFERTSGTGLCISIPLNGLVYVKNATISNHTKGGAMFTYLNNGVDVTLQNCTISNNSNTLPGSLMASAVRVYVVLVDNALPHEIPKLRIIQTLFVGNRHFGSQPMSTLCIMSHVLAAVQDSNFTDNYGTAITAYTTSRDHVMIVFSGTVSFRNNTSHRGGAVHLFQSRIGLKRGANVLFEDNFAKDVGGVIYVHSTQWLSSYYESNVESGNYGYCFYVLIECSSYNRSYYRAYFNLTFVNNSAEHGGEDIYGASIRSKCNICPGLSGGGLATSFVQHLFHFYRPNIPAFSSISSHPSRVCMCSHNSEVYSPRYFCTNRSLILLSRSVYPGEEFNFEAVLVGAEFGTGTGLVYAQFLSHSSSELRPQHQYSQRVDDYKKCTLLTYTVYSSNPKEILVLTSRDETVLKYEDQQRMKEDINSIVINSRSSANYSSIHQPHPPSLPWRFRTNWKPSKMRLYTSFYHKQHILQLHRWNRIRLPQ